MLAVREATHATAPSRPSCIRLLRDAIRLSCGSWPRKVGVAGVRASREFEDYLACGRLEYGFLRVRCERCHEEKLVAFSCKRRWLLPELRGPTHGRECRAAGRRGAAARTDAGVLSVPYDLRLSRRQPASHHGAALGHRLPDSNSDHILETEDGVGNSCFQRCPFRL